MFVLYNLLLTLTAPLWVPWMWWRTRQRGEAPNWKERTGDITLPKPTAGRPRIWVHAVSVGEVIAAQPILAALRRELPEAEIVLSVTTSSGHRTAREQSGDLFDHLVYFPIDVPRFSLAAMTRVRPDVVAVMETELWMNFLWAAEVMGADCLLVNGRISDRSFRRARPFRFFYRSLLRMVDECLMQTEADASRIRELGATNVRVLGNTKYDQAIDAAQTAPDELRSRYAIDPARPVIVIGSSRKEEEPFLAAAFANLPPELQILHAPRHLERIPELEAARAEAGLTDAGRVSRGDTFRTHATLLLDTYGELAVAYAVADIAVIGGGFANLGGQNLIQPLAAGVPVIHGPHMANFRTAADEAVAVGASVIAATPEELGIAVSELLTNDEKRSRMAQAALATVERHRGAAERYAAEIARRARAKMNASSAVISRQE